MTHPAAHPRMFHRLVLNTFLAHLATSFLWFSLNFWVYLESRSVMVSALLAGSYMLLVAVAGVPFGSLLDRHHKYPVMAISTAVTTGCYALAGVVFLVAPHNTLSNWRTPFFWLFAGLLLIGAVVASLRQLGLSTSVTILVPAEQRDKANGLVGTVTGVGFTLNTVASGLAVGYLGFGWVMIIALSLTVLTLVHYLLRVRIPEQRIMHDNNLPKSVDFAGAWSEVRSIPGLLGLLVFSTFNNLLGGVFMALLDPYGLTLMPVQLWGLANGVLGFAFIIGGLAVVKLGLGSKPVRAILLVNVVMWLVGLTFVIRESVVLLLVGALIYLAAVPVAEAAEQTVMQTVVPAHKQGRVFGFAQSVEISATPITSLLIGPIAEYWLIPYMSGPGQQQLSWLLGHGQARGIALVFVLAASIGLLVTIAAFASKSYRMLSGSYERSSAVQQEA